RERDGALFDYGNRIGRAGACEIESRAIIGLQRIEVGKAWKIVEGQLIRLKVKRSRQQPLQDLAAAEVPEISRVGMGDQPRAVAFSHLRDSLRVNSGLRQQRDVVAPAATAQDVEIALDGRSTIEAVLGEGADPI